MLMFKTARLDQLIGVKTPPKSAEALSNPRGERMGAIRGDLSETRRIDTQYSLELRELHKTSSRATARVNQTVSIRYNRSLSRPEALSSRRQP